MREKASTQQSCVLYQSGLTLAEVAGRTGRSVTRVWQALVDAGVPRRSRTWEGYAQRRVGQERTVPVSVERVCPICGTAFVGHNWRATYCSPRCRRRSPGLKHRPDARVARAPDATCEHCGGAFLRRKRAQRFCSKPCVVAYRVGKPRPWKRGLAPVELICLRCRTPFELPHAEARKRVGYCSRQCGTLARIERGEMRMPAWGTGNAKGGRRADLDGQYFRSIWEANYARYLNWLVSFGHLVKWEYEADTFEFPVKRGTRFYTPDFKLTFPNGHVEYHEVKGYMDSRSQTQLDRMRRYYPQVIVRVIDKVAYYAIAKFRASFPGWESAREPALPVA